MGTRSKRQKLSIYQRAVKRLLDVLLSVIGLIVLSPFLPLIAIAIKIEGPGPVLFYQQRAGLLGKPFMVIKFRTMVVDAEKKLGNLIDKDALIEPVFKINHDPRVTRVGKVLRRWSIDEIPQLINVLRGEMSLVGPRPEETWLVNRYTDAQRRRLSVKPGLTGPMQIAGRGELDFPTRLELDLQYIDKYSLANDFVILLKSIPAVLKGRGAF